MSVYKGHEYVKSHMRLQDVGLPDKHRFPMRKYRMTREALQADSSMQDLIEAREVTVPGLTCDL